MKAELPSERGVSARRVRLTFALCLFLLAFGVRLLAWQDSRLEARRVQWAVADNYRHSARLLAEGGPASFFSRTSPLADPDTLGHPPGYPLLLATVARARGTNDIESSQDAARMVQLAADAAAAVILFLLVAELLPFGAAVVAGLLAALAPQFTWNAVLHLPDTLAAFFVLLAVYLLARATRQGLRPRLMTFVLAGMSIGVSCWLRSNALLLAPFLAVAAWLLFARERRMSYALALVAGAAIVVAPLTLRNAVVFGRFIPVSLGAGQTLLEGIADYDDAGRFGIPATDLGIMRQEAAATGREDYAQTLFGPDAVERERARLRRGSAVITSHPFWFASVMARRAASMLKLERARPVSTRPPTTFTREDEGRSQLVWTRTPPDLAREPGASVADGAEVTNTDDGPALRIAAAPSSSAPQFVSAPINVEGGTDYALELMVRVIGGRVNVGVLREGEREPHVSHVIDPYEGYSAELQPPNYVPLLFASPSRGDVRLFVANAPSGAERPVFEITNGPKLHKLGPARMLWTRYPRVVINAVQKVFITAVVLPLALAGLLLVALGRDRRALVVLLAVPVYYMCVQSALHTEYRYVLAINYTLFALAAVTLYRAGAALLRLRPSATSQGEV